MNTHFRYIMVLALALFMAWAMVAPLSAASTQSVTCRVEARQDTGAWIVYDKTELSPTIGDEVNNPVLSIDGVLLPGWSKENPVWDTTRVKNGWHEAVIKDGDVEATQSLLVLNNPQVQVEGGVIEEYTYWTANIVHVLRNDVRVAEGVKLEIQRDAVVKFAPGTYLQVDGTLNATDVTFTALADDENGGDTDDDLYADVPFGSYEICGDGEINLVNCHQYYSGDPPPESWKTPTGLAYSMTCDALVEMLDGSIMKSPGSLLAFFNAQGECMGVAEYRLTRDGDNVLSGQIWSNQPKEAGVVIKLFNSDCSVITTLDEKLTFEDGGAYGTSTDPVILHNSHLVTLNGEEYGRYVAGTAIKVEAEVPKGREFDSWAAVGLTLTEEQKYVNPLEFTMPDNSVDLTYTTKYTSFVTWTLNKGWNWVATNMTPEDPSVAAVLAKYPAQDGDQIKGVDGFSTYYARYNAWEPATLKIIPGKMYAFLRNGTDTATVDIPGVPLAADATIDVVAGWNWIGCFTSSDEIDVDMLLHSAGFTLGDQLKGRSAYTTFCEVTRPTTKLQVWDGTLRNMEVGLGYKLRVANAGTLSVLKPKTRSTRSARALRAVTWEWEGPWEPPKNMSESMTLQAVVKDADGNLQEVANSGVGVFDDDGLCRGVGILQTTAWGSKVYFIQVFSNTCDEKNLTMKFWNAETGVVSDIVEKVDFVKDYIDKEPRTLNLVDTKVFTYNFETGWNLVTPTLNLTADSCNAIMALHPMVLESPDAFYRPAKQEEVVPGKALWIYAKSAGKLVVSGSSVHGWEFVVVPGFSFIGAVQDVEKLPAGASAWQWINGAYSPVYTLVAGRAYWIQGESQK